MTAVRRALIVAIAGLAVLLGLVCVFWTIGAEPWLAIGAVIVTVIVVGFAARQYVALGRPS